METYQAIHPLISEITGLILGKTSTPIEGETSGPKIRKDIPAERAIFPYRNTLFFKEYCKSLKYSGNNKIAIIALSPYELL